MSTFTKSHLEVIASTINSHLHKGVEKREEYFSLIKDLANQFELTNDRFNRAKFYDACTKGVK
jgi:hypothetical protein